MTVALVGAGPGGPELLTVRGAELLAVAEVVVHDRLAHPDILGLAPAGAERISVGKQPPHSEWTTQQEINEILVDRGLKGLRVVRLKGGDPMVFGRGAEEAAALAEAGVEVEIVPGITSAIAAPEAAGIPVTLRQVSTSFTVVTGHQDPRSVTETNWEALAQVGGTIVILMGAARIGGIAERLIGGGLDATTPVASVRWGTRPEQTVIRSDLANIGTCEVKAPSTIVIGPVAADLSPTEILDLAGTADPLQ